MIFGMYQMKLPADTNFSFRSEKMKKRFRCKLLKTNEILVNENLNSFSWFWDHVNKLPFSFQNLKNKDRLLPSSCCNLLKTKDILLK